MDRHLIEIVCRVGAPLSREQPWVGWLLVALCRQRAAQDWLLEIHGTHLSQVDDQVGDVPGLEGWRYAYHGRGLCLRALTGELVDMDLDHEGPPAATIDPMFFAGRVRAMHAMRAAHPEARVHRHLPSSDLILAALRTVRRVAAVHHPTSNHVFRLAARLEAFYPQIAAIDFGSRRVRRRWSQAFGDHDDASAVRVSRAWIVAHLQARRQHASLLRDLHDVLDAPQLRAVAEPLLRGPLDAYFAYAVDALRACGDPPPPGVDSALDRLDPAIHHPFPAHAVTRYLLEHGVERARCLATIEAFAAVDVVKGYLGNPYRDHLAVLMAHHDPDRAFGLFRLAVLDPTPSVYEPVGALLALHPDPRAPRLLLEAALSGDGARKRILLAFLANRDDRASQELARIHMPPAPEPASAHGYTLEEVQHANLRMLVSRRLEEARATLAALTPH